MNESLVMAEVYNSKQKNTQPTNHSIGTYSGHPDILGSIQSNQNHPLTSPNNRESVDHSERIVINFKPKPIRPDLKIQNIPLDICEYQPSSHRILERKIKS